MNILLIAPDQPGINNVPEVRKMSEMHRTHVFNGTVSYEDLHDAVRNNAYDVIHFATHMRASMEELDSMALSGDDYIDLDRAVTLCKLANAQIAVFNLCLAARFAAYLIHRGIPFTIYTTVEIKEHEAWTLPVTFYERVRRIERTGGTIDFHDILESINTGNGIYHWAASVQYFVALIRPIESRVEALAKQLIKIAEIVAHHGELLGSRSTILPVRNRTLLVAVLVFAVSVVTIASLISVYDSIATLLSGL